MSQTLSASTLLAVPLAPLAGSALAGLFGTAFGGNWIGRRLAHTLTILGVFVAFVLSALTLYSVAVHGARFNETIYTWMVVGGLKMEVGFLVDSLTAEDWFMVAADFDSYLAAQTRAAQLYRDPQAWRREAVLNTAGMGWFSSDRSIAEYASDIWGVPVAP